LAAGAGLKRYLIHHGRSLTLDLIDEDGVLSVERYRSGKRERMTINEFELSPEGRALAGKLTMAMARARSS
jgi:hypothetical protein